MGTWSVWHWLVVLLVVLLLFGAGRLPRLASDLAQGIKNFRKGMQEDDGKDETGKRKALEGKSEPSAENRKD
jgi:sec-independent protein translocase protein TatA